MLIQSVVAFILVEGTELPSSVLPRAIPFSLLVISGFPSQIPRFDLDPPATPPASPVLESFVAEAPLLPLLAAI